MHALIVIANVLAMHATESTLVLDGCSTASAERAATIGAMAPQDPRTLDAVIDLLGEPDGAVCLMESWTLVKVLHTQPDQHLAFDAIGAVLVDGLGSPQSHIAARAARLVRVLGVGDARLFAGLIDDVDMTPRAWRVLRGELAAMPEGWQKDTLVGAVEQALPKTATRAR